MEHARRSGWQATLQLVQVRAAERAAALLYLVDELDHPPQQRHLQSAPLGVCNDRPEVRVDLRSPLADRHVPPDAAMGLLIAMAHLDQPLQRRIDHGSI